MSDYCLLIDGKMVAGDLTMPVINPRDRRGTGAVPAVAVAAAKAAYIARREQLAALCEQDRIPAIYEWSLFVKYGGLMSYSPRITDVSHQVGVYAGKILKGAAPADLPV